MAEERELVTLAAGGDRDAFRALYEMHVRLVFGFLRARVGAQVAEDLTAETFCRAWEHVHGYEWRGVPFKAWLLRIAQNLVIARSRRRSTSDVVTDRPEDLAVMATEDETDAADASNDVFALLAALPERQRVVIDLRYLRDLSVGETAVVMEMTEEGVRALAYRAMTALRAAAESRGTPHPDDR